MGDTSVMVELPFPKDMNAARAEVESAKRAAITNAMLAARDPINARDWAIARCLAYAEDAADQAIVGAVWTNGRLEIVFARRRVETCPATAPC